MSHSIKFLCKGYAPADITLQLLQLKVGTQKAHTKCMQQKDVFAAQVDSVAFKRKIEKDGNIIYSKRQVKYCEPHRTGRSHT